MASNATVKTIPIIRMECPTCIPVLEREVKQLKGVTEARGNYLNKTLQVSYDPETVQLEEIEAAIERIGYRIAYKTYPGVVSRIIGRIRGVKDEEITSLTDIDFPGKVLHTSRPVAILFSSPTCPVCHVFKRQFKEIAEKGKGKATFYEMDISSTETWREYDIMSIPTVLIFKNGRLFERFDALPKGEEVARSLR